MRACVNWCEVEMADWWHGRMIVVEVSIVLLLAEGLPKQTAGELPSSFELLETHPVSMYFHSIG